MKSAIWALATVGSLAIGSPSEAQDRSGSSNTLRVAGHLVRLTVDGELPIPSETVTLHRIGRQSGPVDSVNTTARGEFSFSFAADSSSMYVVTARHHGIAYSSPPARLGDAGGEYEIVAFDTTSQPMRVAIAGRHVIVSQPDALGDRTVIEVVELQNDSVVTRVAAEGRPVFVLQLPQAAVRPSTRQGDFIGSSVEFAEHEARVIAPLAPGVRQLVLQYVLPSSAFPVGFDLQSETAVLEILLEEPGASASLSSAELSTAESVTTDGRSFQRMLSRTVPAGAVLQISTPPVSSGVPLGALVIALVSSLALAGLWMWRRHTPHPVPSVSAEANEVLRSISALDVLIADASTPNAARKRLIAERADKYARVEQQLARGAESN